MAWRYSQLVEVPGFRVTPEPPAEHPQRAGLSSYLSHFTVLRRVLVVLFLRTVPFPSPFHQYLQQQLLAHSLLSPYVL